MKLHSLRYLIKEGIRNIWSNRTMTIASVGVLVSCLLLTGAAVLFSLNIASAMSSIEGENSITVYMQKDLPSLESINAGEQIRNMDNISTCVFVEKDEALKGLLNQMGDDGSLYNGLFEGLTGKDNFLPDAYKISLKDISRYDETISQIKQVSGVDSITDYSDIADKLSRLDRLITTAGFWIILILSVVSLFIIANTIRVTMYSRRMEISIMKSVGATNGFIRIPFIIEGIVIGLFSGGVASLLLALAYNAMLDAVVEIVPFFSLIPLNTLLWQIIVVFLFAGCLFGALGGVISISKYLKKEGGDIIAW